MLLTKLRVFLLILSGFLKSRWWKLYIKHKEALAVQKWEAPVYQSLWTPITISYAILLSGIRPFQLFFLNNTICLWLSHNIFTKNPFKFSVVYNFTILITQSLSKYFCVGQFSTPSRSRHVSVQHQTGEWHVATSRTSDRECPFNSNPKRLI